MTKWIKIQPEEAEKIWDQNLISFSDYSPFQTFSWGEYNRAFGWDPVHLVAHDTKGKIIGMMLGLVRRYPFGVGLAWSPGGPVGKLSSWNKDWSKEIASAIGVKHLYFRMRFDRERDINDVLAMNKSGWMRSWFILHSSWTVGLDLTKSDEELSGKFSRSWRRNLKLSRKRNVSTRLWTNPDVDRILKVFNEMQECKNLPALVNREELEQLFSSVRENMVCMAAYNENDQLLAIRICLLSGSRAIDYLAATGSEGRKNYASYGLLAGLLSECRTRGVIDYDLGGIDPHENPEVYQFKIKNRRPPELNIWVNGIGQRHR